MAHELKNHIIGTLIIIIDVYISKDDGRRKTKQINTKYE